MRRTVVEVSKFDILGKDGKPISFTIRTDLSSSTIRTIMNESIRVSEDKGYFHGRLVWDKKLAAYVIVEPEEYSGQEDRLGRLSFGTFSGLLEKIDERYPFWDNVPLKSLKMMQELSAKDDRRFENWRRERNERQIQEEVDIMLRGTDMHQDLVEADDLLSSILNHASQMSAELVAMMPPDGDVSKVCKSLKHMSTLKEEVERAQMILRRISQ